MKKIYSLIIMLALLCMSWTAKAQTLTVYDGSATSSNVPVHGLWADAFLKCEFVIPADSLADMTNGEISQMTFYLTSPASDAWTGTFQVFMKEVENTTISAYSGTADATIVYQGTLDGTESTMTITFSDNYTYNGGNLLIGVYQIVKGNWKSATFAGTTVNGASLENYSSSSLDAITPTQRNFIPKTTFEYTPAGGITCAKPTALAATVTPGQGTMANLNWIENGTATNWAIEYSTAADFSNASTVTVNGTPAHTLTGLTPETTYYAHVKADCGSENGQSNWSNTVSFMPSYKTRIGSGTGTNSYVPLNNYYKNSLSQQIYTSEELGDAAIISSISFYKSSTTSCNRAVDIYMVSTSKDRFNSATDWIVVDSTDLVFSDSVNFTNNDWTHIELTNPFTYDGIHNVAIIVDDNTGSYVSSTNFLTYTDSNRVLRAYSDSYNFNPFDPSGITSSYNAGVQHAKNQILILKEALGACPKPTGLTASEVSAHSAVLNWTVNGTATAWQICVNEDTNNLIDVTEIPYTLTGLNPETAYLVKVRANCGGEDGMSNWASVNFTTEIACPAPTGLNSNVFGTIVDLNWNSNGDNDTILYRAAAHSDALFFEDFENGLNNWTIYTEGESPTGTGWYTINPSNNLSCEAVSGSYVASAWSWSSYAYNADNWLVSPQIELQGTLKYWVRAHSSYPDHYAVLLSTTGNTISDFTTTLKPMATAPGTWTEVNIDLSAYSGQTGYIAIHHVDNDANYILIDDFGIYGETSPAGDWMTAVSNTHDITLTGLAPTTTYDVKVKADCGEDGPSAWSDIYQFTTGVACPDPISLSTDTVTGISAELSWTGNGESYNLQYRIPSSTSMVFFDDFENGLDNWTIYTEGEAPLTNGWFTLNPSESGIDPISGNNVVAALSYYYDDYYDYDYSYNASNWLVTPQLPLQGTLKFWVISSSSLPEHYSVLLSTTGNAITDFTTTLKEYGTASGVWTQVSIDLSAYEGQNGYIAIHHADTDAYFIFIDDFGIYGESTPASDWITTSTTTNSATLSGLDPLTTYEVQVMSNCGEDGQSGWSDSYFFTTTEFVCETPSTLVVTDTALTSATLSWTENGFAEAWQISIIGAEEQILNVTENPYTITNLTPGTEYAVKVRANCTEEISSEWSETITFTTLPEIIPTEITISGDTVACPGGTTTLTASTDVEATFVWSNEATTAEITVTQGTYTVTVTSTTGNQLSKSVTVIAYPTYEVTDAETICASLLPYTWNGIEFTEAGTQNVTLQTVNGCDSVVTMTLTVNPIYEVTDAKTICETELPYTWNGVEFTEAGTQSVTLQTVNGCDSAVAMTLTVNPVVYGVDGWTICASELPYTYQGIEFTEAGTKFDTLTAANGCDSIVTITLVVKESFTATDTKTICASELPYEWNGVTFTEAGTQNVTLDATNGCDSVVTMTLTVNPIYAISESRTICAVDMPYTWNGVTFTEAGTQTATLQTVDGCDSVITMTVSVNTAYNVTETKSICQSSLPYTWNEVVFNEAGTQEVTLQSTSGCDSVIIMILTVNPVYAVNDSVTICASELPYEWNGVEFSESATLPVTLQTANGCDSVVTMTVTVKETYHVNEDRVACANELPYVWNGVTFNGTGTETVTLTAVNGCDSTVTMHLSVNPVYTTPIVANICEGDSYEFLGQILTETGIYTDTLEAVTGCDSIITLTLNVHPTFNTPISYTMCQGETCVFFGQALTTAGEYTHTLYTSHGCDSIITLTLIVNPTYNTPIAESICEGESYTFFGQNLTTAGEYTHTLSTVNGCDSVITLTLTVNPNFNTPIAQAICEGDSYDFFGQTLTTAGTYTHTLEAVTGCDSVITLTLSVNPTFNTPISAAICQGESYNFFGQSLTTAGTYTHTLQAVTGCDSVITLTLTVNPTYNVTDAQTICASQLPYTWNGVAFTEAGTQSVTLQTVNGCDSVVAMTLTVNPIYNVTDAQTICANQLPYTWNGVVFTAAGTQNVTLQSVNGCDSVVVMTLTVNPIYNVTDAQTICESELPYTWNGVVFSAAGTQNVTLQSVNGCDSVVVMTLTVNPTYSTLLAESICQGETYNFFGQALTEAGSYNHTLQAVTGCDSVIILDLTVNPIYNVTDAMTICPSELPYTWNGVVFTEAGTQTVTLTAATGCDSIVAMTLTVNTAYAVNDEAAICNTELPFIWNDIEFLEAGSQTVTLTAANGCDSVVTMTLTVNFSVTEEYDVETSDSCYEWNGILYCESGDYTQTLTTVAGCDSVVTIHLTTRVGVNNYELDSNVYIAPNPAKNVCRILGLSTEPKYVEVYDMRGGLVMRTNNTEFDVRTLSTGLYMVRVYTGERIINLKLVKE